VRGKEKRNGDVQYQEWIDRLLVMPHIRVEDQRRTWRREEGEKEKEEGREIVTERATV
jgi:hypothetical protein